MNKNKVRTDNKKSQLYYELSFAALILCIFGINVANTQKVTNLYVVAAIMLIAFIAYAILYTIFINRFKNDLLLEDNYVAYYVSGYIHSRRLKITTAIIDFIALLGTISFGLYYFIKMDFINVYPEYLVIFLGLIAFIQLFILIKDISKIKSIDRIDAITNKYAFSIIDKKITFAIVTLIVCALNIGMLSYKTHNFIVYYSDLIIFEIIALITLLSILSTIIVTRIYYSYYSFRQIQDNAFEMKILEEIGKGANAIVYKAYVPSLDTIYAVKKLNTTDPKKIIRFDAEFKLIKSLAHPNIIKVYTYDELKYQYSMDYMPYTLSEFINCHKLNNTQKFN